MSSLIQVSDSNAIVYISSTPYFGQLTTVRDIAGNRSTSNIITVSTVGITFGDGSSTKIIDTPYATLTVDSSAKVVHQFPFTYGVSKDADGLTTDISLTVAGPTTIYDSLFTYDSISSFGNIDANAIYVIDPTNSIGTRSTLVSTVQGIGQYYVSSIIIPIDSLQSSGYTVRSNVISTVNNLGTFYISVPTLQSTIDSIAVYKYVSVASLASTVRNLSTSYVVTSNLTSTVAGLGTFGYVSKADFLSTVASFRGGYIRDPSYQSTIAGLATANYVCTSQLGSTLTGLGIPYISTGSLLSVTAGLLNSPFPGFSTLYVSTTEGAGQNYISSAGLISTVIGVSGFNASTLQSTIVGLGTSGYLSTSGLTSTIDGLGQIYISSSVLQSTVGSLFNSNYTQSFVSTVQNLGTTGYLSTLLPMTSSVIGYEAAQMMSTVAGAGTPYLSTTQLFSTVVGLSNIYVTIPVFLSTVAGETSFNTSNLVSTVCGLGSLYDSYISTIQLLSTVSNVTTIENSLFTEAITNISTSYFKTEALLSTVQGLSNTYATPSNLISSVVGIGSFNTGSLVSTVCGLGSTKSYVSTGHLFSTVTNVTAIDNSLFTQAVTNISSSYFTTGALLSTVQGLSNIYTTPSNLISSVAGIGSFNTASLVSTVCGMGSTTSYVSADHLLSTVSNVTAIDNSLFMQSMVSLSNVYFTTGALLSTVQGLSNIYATPSNLISSVAGIGSFNTSSLVSTVCGLGSTKTYVSTGQLFSTVSNVTALDSSFFSQTMNNLGYLTTPFLFSTVEGITSMYIVASNLISTAAILSSFDGDVLASTMVGMGNSSYISTPQLVSTVKALIEEDDLYYIQVLPTLASPPFNYIPTISLSSTILGLNTAASLHGFNYVLKPNLASTITQMNINFGVNLISTNRGLRFIGQPPDIGGPPVVGSDQSLLWASEFLSGIAPIYGIKTNTYVNTFNTLGNIYVSTQSMNSTVSGLIAFSLLTDNNQVAQLSSTLSGLQTSNSIVIGNYINGLQTSLVSNPVFISTVSTVKGSNTEFNISLVNSLGSPPYSYMTTASLVSTVSGLAAIGYVSSTQLFSAVSNVASLNLSATSSTIAGLASVSYISTTLLVSTIQGMANIYISSAGLLSNVSTYLSSQKYTDAQLTSSIANLGTKGYVSATSMVSTVAGLGTFYISTPNLVSTVIGLSNTYANTATIPATTVAIQAVLLVSSLVSTTAGLGSLGYVSSLNNPDIFTVISKERAVLKTATAQFTTALGSRPATQYSNFIIPDNSAPIIYMYQSNAIIPSSNIRVIGEGIKTADIYCTQDMYVIYGDFRAKAFYCDGTKLITSSDRRLKFDIVPLSNALNSLTEIKGTSYSLIDTPDKKFLGFLAQDIEQVYPELVFQYTEHKSIKYDSIGVILLEAIKELNCECDEMLASLSLSYNKGV